MIGFELSKIFSNWRGSKYQCIQVRESSHHSLELTLLELLRQFSNVLPKEGQSSITSALVHNEVKMKFDEQEVLK